MFLRWLRFHWQSKSAIPRQRSRKTRAPSWIRSVSANGRKPIPDVPKEWCPESDLNQRPTAYEAVALPLSYRGDALANRCSI